MKNSNILKHSFAALAVFITLSCCHTDYIATVECTVHGCLGEKRSKITIYKMDSSMLATLEKDGEISHRVKLSAQQLDTFYMFIQDLKALEEGSSLCTDVSYYTVFAHNETFHKTVRYCLWNGFHKIKTCLFKNNNNLEIDD